MNRVGLCVVWRNQNCGSMLQSFATLRKLRSLGCECEVIDYSPVKNAAFYLKSLHRLRCPDLVYSRIRSLKRKIGKVFHPDFRKNDALRAAKFRQFVRECFGEFSEPIHDYDALKAYASRFTDVLAGSDQLWLPSGLETGFYNLAFVPDEVNRIAYAASFGVPEIPAFQTDKTKAYLERIPYLSVREESGQKIVRSLTGRDVPVLPDPAMALSRAEWDEAIPDEIICGDGYVFAYLLGSDPGQREEVRKLAEAKGLKTVVLRHLDEYVPADERFGDVSPWDAGPAEFVNLIRHASYVCTDSFHGSVFSILYHKQFVTFDRYAGGANSRNGRLDTLFGILGIRGRFEGDLSGQIDRETDWEAVDSKLSELRGQADRFLREALGRTEIG